MIGRTVQIVGRAAIQRRNQAIRIGRIFGPRFMSSGLDSPLQVSPTVSVGSAFETMGLSECNNLETRHEKLLKLAETIPSLGKGGKDHDVLNLEWKLLISKVAKGCEEKSVEISHFLQIAQEYSKAVGNDTFLFNITLRVASSAGSLPMIESLVKKMTSFDMIIRRNTLVHMVKETSRFGSDHLVSLLNILNAKTHSSLQAARIFPDLLTSLAESEQVKQQLSPDALNSFRMAIPKLVNKRRQCSYHLSKSISDVMENYSAETMPGLVQLAQVAQQWAKKYDDVKSPAVEKTREIVSLSSEWDNVDFPSDPISQKLLFGNIELLLSSKKITDAWVLFKAFNKSQSIEQVPSSLINGLASALASSSKYESLLAEFREMLPETSFETVKLPKEKSQLSKLVNAREFERMAEILVRDEPSDLRFMYGMLDGLVRDRFQDVQGKKLDAFQTEQIIQEFAQHTGISNLFTFKLALFQYLVIRFCGQRSNAEEISHDILSKPLTEEQAVEFLDVLRVARYSSLTQRVFKGVEDNMKSSGLAYSDRIRSKMVPLHDFRFHGPSLDMFEQISQPSELDISNILKVLSKSFDIDSYKRIRTLASPRVSASLDQSLLYNALANADTGIIRELVGNAQDSSLSKSLPWKFLNLTNYSVTALRELQSIFKEHNISTPVSLAFYKVMKSNSCKISKPSEVLMELLRNEPNVDDRLDQIFKHSPFEYWTVLKVYLEIKESAEDITLGESFMLAHLEESILHSLSQFEEKNQVKVILNQTQIRYRSLFEDNIDSFVSLLEEKLDASRLNKWLLAIMSTFPGSIPQIEPSPMHRLISQSSSEESDSSQPLEANL